MYIYSESERERERERYLYLSIYIYIVPFPLARRAHRTVLGSTPPVSPASSSPPPSGVEVCVDESSCHSIYSTVLHLSPTSDVGRGSFCLGVGGAPPFGAGQRAPLFEVSDDNVGPDGQGEPFCARPVRFALAMSFTTEPAPSWDAASEQASAEAFWRMGSQTEGLEFLAFMQRWPGFFPGEEQARWRGGGGTSSK